MRLTTGPLVAEITLDPWRLRFLDLTGGRAGRRATRARSTSAAGCGRCRSDAPRWMARWSPTTRASPPRPTSTSSASARSSPRFDKRGQRAVMWNYDAFGAESDRAYKNVPFYLSSRGYGVLVDSGMATEFDLCQSTHSCVQIVVPDDLHRLLRDRRPDAGRDPGPVRPADRPAAAAAEVGLRHLDLVGVLCGHSGQVLARARTHPRARDPVRRPAPGLLLAGRRALVGSALGRGQLPRPGRHVGRAGRAGLPGQPLDQLVHQSSQPALRRGRTSAATSCAGADGSTYVADVWHGSHPACGIVDFTNPTATEWFQALLRPLLRQGVTVFKTDFAEGVPVDAVAEQRDDRRRAAQRLQPAVQRRGRRGHPRGGRARHGLGPLVVPRRAAALGPVERRHELQLLGDGQHPARRPVARAVRHPVLEPRRGRVHRHARSPDLYVRWAQFGALSPLVRFHGTTSRLPWDFPDFAEAAAVDARPAALPAHALPLLGRGRVGPDRRADDAGAAGRLRPTTRPPGTPTSSTCSAPTCWSRR